jgi:signal peptidase I
MRFASLVALLAAAATGVATAFTVLPVRVRHGSMMPTLHDGQLLLCLRTGALQRAIRPLREGDIAVLRLGGDVIVKRIASLEISPNTGDPSIFVIGDNADHSTDSRTFGAVSIHNVRGLCRA